MTPFSGGSVPPARGLAWLLIVFAGASRGIVCCFGDAADDVDCSFEPVESVELVELFRPLLFGCTTVAPVPDGSGSGLDFLTTTPLGAASGSGSAGGAGAARTTGFGAGVDATSGATGWAGCSAGFRCGGSDETGLAAPVFFAVEAPQPMIPSCPRSECLCSSCGGSRWRCSAPLGTTNWWCGLPVAWGISGREVTRLFPSKQLCTRRNGHVTTGLQL